MTSTTFQAAPFRVGLVCPPAAHARCGVEDYTERLAGALSAEGIEVARLFEAGTSGPSLAARARAEGCRLLHLQYPGIGYGASLWPHFLPLVTRLPVLVTLHEFSRTNALRKTSSLLFSSGLHRLVFTTPDERSAFRQSFPWWRGVSAVIPIGSNIPFLDRAPDPVPTIGFFGHLKPNRGLEPFIELARLCADAGRPYRFVILGSIGPGQDGYHDHLRQLADGLPVEWRLDLDAGDVAKAVSRCMAFYMAFPDGASMRRTTLLTALGNGVPVITTDGPLCPDRLRDAVLFASGPQEASQHLETLLTDPKLAARLGEAGRAYARRFDWSRVAATHRELYEGILQGSGIPAVAPSVERHSG
jgi:glycosyltransferase involved in cell wall biosynthesis